MSHTNTRTGAKKRLAKCQCVAKDAKQIDMSRRNEKVLTVMIINRHVFTKWKSSLMIAKGAYV